MLQNFDHSNGEISRDRREKDRQITIFRLAKVESGSAEGWGFIKNISSSGVMIEIHPSFQLGETTKVALTDDLELIGNVRWRKGALAGMQFSDDIDVTELLANLSVRNKQQPPRLPRVRTNRAIILRIGSTVMKAEICDISPGGIRINSHYRFEVGNRLTLLVPELGDIVGTVRWQKGPEIGIKFQDRISVPQITDWLASYHVKSQDAPQ